MQTKRATQMQLILSQTFLQSAVQFRAGRIARIKSELAYFFLGLLYNFSTQTNVGTLVAAGPLQVLYSQPERWLFRPQSLRQKSCHTCSQITISAAASLDITGEKC